MEVFAIFARSYGKEMVKDLQECKRKIEKLERVIDSLKKELQRKSDQIVEIINSVSPSELEKIFFILEGRYLIKSYPVNWRDDACVEIEDDIERVVVSIWKMV